ncbi:hypothetical protein [Natronoglomus mannanivorans]|uniref:Uncharacterized protein n=1 Tax=Natronoglomus mannanivorans TaxID=2979990 RepID=A0AAP2Z4P3_9EURY|nr:hypothetical protein [Halobacteria archaeon AArc-xg1-1]
MSYTPPTVDDINFELEESETTSTDSLDFDFTQAIIETATVSTTQSSTTLKTPSGTTPDVEYGSVATVSAKSEISTPTVDTPDDSLNVDSGTDWSENEGTSDDTVFVEDDSITTSEEIDGTDLQADVTTSDSYDSDYHHWEVEMLQDFTGTIRLYCINQTHGWDGSGEIEIYSSTSTDDLEHSQSYSNGDTTVEVDVDLEGGQTYYIGHTSGSYRTHDDGYRGEGEYFNLTKSHYSYGNMGIDASGSNYGFYQLDVIQEPESSAGEWNSTLWNPSSDDSYDLTHLDVSATQSSTDDIVDVRVQGYDSSGTLIDGENTGYVPVSDASDIGEITGDQFGVDFKFYESTETSYVDSYTLGADVGGISVTKVGAVSSTTSPSTTSSVVVEPSTTSSTATITTPLLRGGTSVQPTVATSSTTIASGSGQASKALEKIEASGTPSYPGVFLEDYVQDSKYSYAISDWNDTLRKFDDDGVVWEIGIDSDNSPKLIEVDASGNIYVATGTSTGPADLLSYDGSGDLRWIESDPMSSDEPVRAMAVDNNGGLVIQEGYWATVYRHRTSTGRQDWQYSTSNEGACGVELGGDGSAYATVEGGSSTDAYLYKISEGGYDDGDRSFRDNQILTKPLVESDDVHVTLGVDGELQRVDTAGDFPSVVETGDTIAGEILNSTIDDEDNFYFTNETGSFGDYSYNLLKYNWSDGLVWEVSLPYDPGSIDVTTNGNLYVFDDDSYEINVYNTSDGSHQSNTEWISGTNLAVFPDYSGNSSAWEIKSTLRKGIPSTESRGGALNPDGVTRGAALLDRVGSISTTHTPDGYGGLSTSVPMVSASGSSTTPDTYSEVSARGSIQEAKSGMIAPTPTASATTETGIIHGSGEIRSPSTVSSVEPDVGIVSSYGGTRVPVTTAAVSTECVVVNGGATVRSVDTFGSAGASTQRIGASVTPNEPNGDRRVQANTRLINAISSINEIEGYDNLVRVGAIPGFSSVTSPSVTATGITEVGGVEGEASTATPDTFTQGTATTSNTVGNGTPTLPESLVRAFGSPASTIARGDPTTPGTFSLTEATTSTGVGSSSITTPSVFTAVSTTGSHYQATGSPLDPDGSTTVIVDVSKYGATGTPTMVVEPDRPTRFLGRSTNRVIISGGNMASISGGNDVDLLECLDTDR